MKTFAERSKSYIKRPSKVKLVGYEKEKKQIKYNMDFVKKNDLKLKSDMSKDGEDQYVHFKSAMYHTA